MFFVQWRGSPASAIGHPQTWILAKPVRIILIRQPWPSNRRCVRSRSDNGYVISSGLRGS